MRKPEPVAEYKTITQHKYDIKYHSTMQHVELNTAIQFNKTTYETSFFWVMLKYLLW